MNPESQQHRPPWPGPEPEHPAEPASAPLVDLTRICLSPQPADSASPAPVTQPAIPRLSVIIPAYNEEQRLGPTLRQTLDYLDQRGEPFEILVVDDGSTDRTVQVASAFAQERSEVRLLIIPNNAGKGHAVRSGVAHARGAFILFEDADGSTPIEELARLEGALQGGAGVAIASRALLADETRVKANWYRRVLGRAFAFCVNRVLVGGIADTQCGFKLFDAQTARFVFSRQQADRFSFDCEILFIAQRAGIPINEVPVNWQDREGSKVSPWRDGLRMLRDLVIFRLRHGGVTPKDLAAFRRDEPAQDPGPALK